MKLPFKPIVRHYQPARSGRQRGESTILERKYGMGSIVPVAYSRRNIGRSKGNASSMGWAEPNIPDMARKVSAPK